MDNEEKEKFLSINTPKLVELYEKKISEEDKMLMEKQGLKLDTFVERFKDELNDHDFIEGNCAVFSFDDFLKIELSGYSELDLKRDQNFIDLQKEKGYIEERKELINDNMKLDKNNSKDIKDIVEDASKKADDYNNKLEKKEGKVNEKEL